MGFGFNMLSLINSSPNLVACINHEVVVFQPFTVATLGLDSVTIGKSHYIVSQSHPL